MAWVNGEEWPWDTARIAGAVAVSVPGRAAVSGSSPVATSGAVAVSVAGEAFTPSPSPTGWRAHAVPGRAVFVVEIAGLKLSAAVAPALRLRAQVMPG